MIVKTKWNELYKIETERGIVREVCVATRYYLFGFILIYKSVVEHSLRDL